MNEHAAEPGELPHTVYLDHTVRRAITAAGQRTHRYVTLEHLLLALLDDPDAAELLKAVGADATAIRGAVGHVVNNRMAAMVAPDGRQPTLSYRFDLLLQCANQDARRIGRRHIDGALALIAIAKDAESDASGILAANGFSAAAALAVMRRAPDVKRAPQPAPRPAKSAYPAMGSRTPQGQDRNRANGMRPEFSGQAAKLVAGGDSMEDMVLSVRTILEAEELKERERIAAEQRLEPQFKRNGHAPNAGMRAAEAADKLEPRIGPSRFETRAPRDASRANGFSESPAPAFDLEKSQSGEKRPAPGRRGRAGNVALLAKIFETVPRKTRVGVPAKFQISLSREEAGLLFGRASRRAPLRDSGIEPAWRAVSLRVSAPGGAFFVETLTPETQWMGDDPDGDARKTWAWTAFPRRAGTHGLRISMSAQSLTANGPGAVNALADQTIKVRVRGNFRLALGRIERGAYMLLAGSGLTIAAYYLLKIAGKLH